ncbi:uncharacterized protein LOC9660380 [Selaginella moellendorffii]|uniref:uncharacterized protein LOC9660380 n=1 Tax=Selaginella moellendorffii TaxID=88036 RepID=UPI000D1C84AB|nr:uncharacterized protein LOC9660380 [Selaginella moellendorffii]|eukprot:XP_002979345.2 uncharacterized protein LOC9660380 [Selaginella moellendorffii]
MGILQGDYGFQLASDLEAIAAWRPWLGDHLYSELRMHLATPSAWSAFMRGNDGSNSGRLRLQLRVRALLYDKALELQDTRISSPASLQLQPDSVYFTLEHDASDWVRLQAERAPTMAALQAKYGLDNRDTLSPHFAVGDGKQKSQLRKTAINTIKQGRSSPGFRGVEQSKLFSRSSRELDAEKSSMDCDLWYDQWFDKHLSERMNRLARRLAQQKLPFSDQEALKRTPEGMAAFLKLTTKALKRQHLTAGNDISLGHEREQESFDGELSILPELTSISSCVPENPCPATCVSGACSLQQSLESAAGGEASVLSGLSSQLVRSGTSARKAKVSSADAEILSQQTIARILETHGFEGVRQVPMEIFSEVMALHIRKLGSWLRMLIDSYQKHLSTDELLRMFIQRLVSHPARENSDVGGSLRDLAEYLKNEKSRTSQVVQIDAQMSNQLHQLHAQSRNLAAFQRSMYLENPLKKKQLPSLRAKRQAEDHTTFEMKPYVSTLTKQPWIPQQIQASSHSQVMQHLQQQASSLHLPGVQASPKLSNARIDGLHEILGSDVMKQENPDDLDGTLGSPNKRKRKEY